MSSLSVDVVDVQSTTDPPGVRLRYRVLSESKATVWVVDDGWLAWRCEDGRIELCFARGAMRPGVEPFGYFDPLVVELEPAETLERTVQLTWPHRLSRLWNAVAEADPPPGEYELTVRVGYGLTPEPAPPQELGDRIEAPVLAWQHEAVSAPAKLVVPLPVA